MNISYVYVYIDPFTNIPFYVGMGKNKRYLQHLYEAKSLDDASSRKLNKIREILKLGAEPTIIKVEENMQRKDAADLEIFLIKQIGRIDLGTGPLVNLTAGGDGTKELIVTAEIKEKRKKGVLSKYGVEYITQQEEIREKIKRSFIERYGVINPQQIPAVKDKIKETCLKKYGVDQYSKTDTHRDAAKSRFDVSYKNGTHWIQLNRDKISENTLKQVELGKNYFTSEKHKAERSAACKEKNAEMNRAKHERKNVAELKLLYLHHSLKQSRGGIWVKQDTWINSEIIRLTTNPFGE